VLDQVLGGALAELADDRTAGRASRRRLDRLTAAGVRLSLGAGRCRPAEPGGVDMRGTDVVTGFIGGCPLLPIVAAELSGLLGAVVEAWSDSGVRCAGAARANCCRRKPDLDEASLGGFGLHEAKR
jgi:hypothetical protein